MRSQARCSSREAARFAISKHCRACNRHSLGSPSIVPTFLPGGSLRLSVTGACYHYYPVIRKFAPSGGQKRLQYVGGRLSPIFAEGGVPANRATKKGRPLHLQKGARISARGAECELAKIKRGRSWSSKASDQCFWRSRCSNPRAYLFSVRKLWNSRVGSCRRRTN